MSAFVVSKEHIGAMLRGTMNVNRSSGRRLYYHFDGKSKELGADNAEAVGQMLLDENVKSCGYRYPEDRLTELPGLVNAEWIIPFKFDAGGPVLFTAPPPTAIELIKITQCYEYQSCEHPGWGTSEAKAIVDAIIHTAIPHLRGYDDAPWDWDTKEAAEA